MRRAGQYLAASVGGERDWGQHGPKNQAPCTSDNKSGSAMKPIVRKLRDADAMLNAGKDLAAKNPSARVRPRGASRGGTCKSGLG